MDITASLPGVIKADHVRRVCRRAMRDGIPPRRKALSLGICNASGFSCRSPAWSVMRESVFPW
jgi:hypothetical protein